MKKFISIVMSIIVVISCFSIVLASDVPTIGTNQISGDGKTFLQNILGTVQWIAYVIAIGWLIYLGIKYVMASADEKASLKGGAVKYIIGAILIVGAGTIFGWIASSSFS
ncbi:MAG: TrbC/VirB2 family protein [Clostridia bacterium]|nr:TrbC/VirB2 family protein [Clostridia bacterium]